MSNIGEVYELVLETAPKLLPAKRARIFRGLAEIIGDEQFAAELLRRARASEKLDRQDGQLSLRFRKLRNRRKRRARRR